MSYYEKIQYIKFKLKYGIPRSYKLSPYRKAFDHEI